MPRYKCRGNPQMEMENVKCENMRDIAGEAVQGFRVGVINKPKMRTKCNCKHMYARLCAYMCVGERVVHMEVTIVPSCR